MRLDEIKQGVLDRERFQGCTCSPDASVHLIGVDAYETVVFHDEWCGLYQRVIAATN